VLVVFTVRPYDCKDLNSVISIYQAVFAEPPWNESWTREEVIEDLRSALRQPQTTRLVAESEKQVLGFTWGYQLPSEMFGLLPNLTKFSYMDEMAVRKGIRKRGIGTLLGEAYIENVKNQGLPGVVLRTDQRNDASMALFKRLGFSSDFNGRKIYDPKYPDRVYLWRTT